MRGFLFETLAAVVLGLLLFAAPQACEVESVPVPGPVGVPEAAVGVTSGGGACAGQTPFQCCQTWVEAAQCDDGHLTCRSGWITCGGEDAGAP